MATAPSQENAVVVDPSKMMEQWQLVLWRCTETVVPCGAKGKSLVFLFEEGRL